MVDNKQIFNALQAVRDIVNYDLLPLFDSFGFEYVPTAPIVETDWLTYLKSTSYNPAIFTTDLESFTNWLKIIENFLSIYNDPTAYSVVKNNSIASSVFWGSPLVCFLPYREVTITNFNLEIMSGSVFILSYLAYSTPSTGSLYWQLRVRASNAVLLQVPYTGTFNRTFQTVNHLMLKEKLGNWYSSTNSYVYETTAMIRVIDV